MPRPSRFTAPALVAILLAASQAAAVSPSKSSCIHGHSQELARLASCGHAGSAAHCLGSLAEYFVQTDLETCFLNAGCTADEAAIEALWTLRRCDNPDNVADLRKRQRTGTPTDDEDEPADDPPKTTARAAPTTAARGRTSVAAAPTRTEEPRPNTNSAPPSRATTSEDDSGVVVVTVTGQTTSATSASLGGLTNTPLVCRTTTITTVTSCPVQTTGAQRGQTLSCFPTSYATDVCVEGLTCSTDFNGNPVCMKLQTSLDTAGVIIALAFAVAATAAVAGLCFFSCREKSRERKAQAKAEAALIAKTAALNGKRPVVTTRSVSSQSAASQPLVAPEAQSLVYEPHDNSNPFHDRHRA